MVQASTLVPNVMRKPQVPPIPADPPPPDYSFQARQLIDKLNAMARAAPNGVVPERAAMMAEINRLLDLSNKQRNAKDYQPAMPTDYHGEALRLIKQLNAMRDRAGGEVPQGPAMEAEIRRLQALGDKMRWGN